MFFRNAIVRLPAANFADGLTTVDLGVPDLHLALRQYSSYIQALEQCGLAITALQPDPRHPDSTFVEDTAVLTPRSAILTRPGAPTRSGEVDAIQPTIGHFFPITHRIEPPGTLDGGDICDADGHFFIGISHRTNEEGARQLAQHLAQEGYTSATIDVRHLSTILHLKSGLSYIGENQMVVIDELAANPLLLDYNLIHVAEQERYAANCVRVNDRVLVPAGYPGLTAKLKDHAFQPLELEMSEFQKMDGGLSCLSLRF